MSKVRLISEYTDDWGNSFNSGQTGESSMWKAQDGTVLVTFDGYEEEKKRNREQYERTGEGFNIVPWLAHVPANLLELIDAGGSL